MENKFKGTKVFPKYEGGDNYSIDMIFDNGATISIDRRNRYSDDVVCDREEMEANAQLISKSPELLEMVSELLKELEFHGFRNSTTIYNAKNLIKEATTI